jgi:hypothetical protein
LQVHILKNVDAIVNTDAMTMTIVHATANVFWNALLTYSRIIALLYSRAVIEIAGDNSDW